MPKENQLGFDDGFLAKRKKVSRLYRHLQQLDALIDWKPLLAKIRAIDKTGTKRGGRPRKNPRWMLKAIFLQHLFSLSDPQLEDQLIDRLSFQRFTGISLDEEIPDFTTFWRFKEALAAHHLDAQLFTLVTRQLEAHGLLVKKGTMVDATIIRSANRPLSQQKRNALQEKPSAQIDTQAHSTCKGGQYSFGYKGHIGVDIGSKLIRRLAFTPANVHDSKLTRRLISYDEHALFGDKAYANTHLKRCARVFGWFYGVLEKARRGQALSITQHKRNKQLSRVRASVEHPFAWLKTKAGLHCMRAKTEARNRLRFTLSCIGWNLNRAQYLLKKA